MEDVNISKYRAQVVRAGSTPASPGFVVSEGQNPVDPSGSGQNHLPVTIATAATGLSITESQVLGGAGTVGQYIRGDGSLADFPATTGGGSSVSYYLNGSVSQGTIGGVAYKELNRTPIFGAGTDISINADGYIASFITDALDPNKLLIPGGNWNFETYFSASSSGGNPSFYIELYKYNGTTFTLIASSSSSPELIAFGTNINPYFSTLAVPQTTLALTDRLAVRFYVETSGRTITLHTENNHLCQVITTFTTGLTALNGLTTQVQFFAVGTSGTDFAISSASDTHTFNLPTASATNRGALSSADWTTFNNKQNALTLTTTGTSGAATLVGSTLNIPQYQAAGTYVTAVTASSPLFSSGGTTPNITIQQASGSQSGFLSSTDWTTFNSKQNALTNPVTGTGTTNYLPKFTGASTIGNSNLSDDGSNLIVDSRNINFGNTGFGVYLSRSGLGPRASLTTRSNINWVDVANSSDWNGVTLAAAGGSVLIGTITDNLSGATLQNSGALTTNTTTVTNGTRSWIISPSGASIQEEFSGVVEGKIDPSSGGNSWLGATSGTTGAGAKHYFSSTGAATFAGNVTANSNFNSIGASTSISPQLNFTQTGGNTYSAIGINRADGTGIAAGIGSALVLRSGDATDFPIQFATANNVRVTIATSGNVGIGTASPGARLTILTPTSDSTVGFNLRAYATGADGDRTVISRYTSSNDNNWANSVYRAWAHIYETNGSERMRITSDGYQRMASGTGGIQFNGDTSSANALDDYEEGAFTPTIFGSSTAGTATYSARNGLYTKIGRAVSFNIYIDWSGGTGSGNLRLSGLPFTASSTGVYPSVAIGEISNIALSANTIATARVQISTNEIWFGQAVVGGGGNSSLAYDAAGYFTLSGTYYV